MTDLIAELEAAELLPCPFCGEPAYRSTRQDEDLWTHNIVVWTQVGCHECGIFFEWPPDAEPDAVTQWNTRALPTAPSGEVERLREALRNILGWRELRSGADEVPISRIEDIARAALHTDKEQEG